MKNIYPFCREENMAVVEELMQHMMGTGSNKNPEIVAEAAAKTFSGQEWSEFYAAVRMTPALKILHFFEMKIVPFINRKDLGEDGIIGCKIKNDQMSILIDRPGVKGFALPDPSKQDMAEDKLTLFATDGEKILIQKTSYHRARCLSFTNKSTIHSMFFDRETERDILRANVKNYDYVQCVGDLEVRDFVQKTIDFAYFCEDLQPFR